MEQRIRSRLEKLRIALEPPEPSEGGAVPRIVIGVLLLATAGLRYLVEIFPEGGLWTALALFAMSLVCAGVAFIIWKATQRSLTEWVAPIMSCRKVGPNKTVLYGDSYLPRDPYPESR